MPAPVEPKSIPNPPAPASQPTAEDPAQAAINSLFQDPKSVEQPAETFTPPASGIRIASKPQSPPPPDPNEFKGSRHQATEAAMSSIQIARRRRNFLIAIVLLFTIIICTTLFGLYQSGIIKVPDIKSALPTPTPRPHPTTIPIPTATNAPTQLTITVTPSSSPSLSPTTKPTPAPTLAVPVLNSNRQPITPFYLTPQYYATIDQDNLQINIKRIARITTPNLPHTGSYLIQITMNDNSATPLIARAIETDNSYLILSQISHPAATSKLQSMGQIDNTPLSINQAYTIEALEYPTKIESSNGLAHYNLIGEREGKYNADTVQAMFTNDFGQVFTTKPAILNQTQEPYSIETCPDTACLNIGFYYVFRPDGTYLIYQ